MRILLRAGQQYSLTDVGFWTCARSGGIKSSDHIFGSDGKFHQATQFSELTEFVKHPANDFLSGLLGAGAVILGALALEEVLACPTSCGLPSAWRI